METIKQIFEKIRGVFHKRATEDTKKSLYDVMKEFDKEEFDLDIAFANGLLTKEEYLKKYKDLLNRKKDCFITKK